ncbi:hypothetical protein N7474_008206 [Penicillium riverlandense]|uniref:uncharacterized protein n=1 Tax=Penicillium riverlandense TaxID=1903569 RepID=UPI0025492A78|nr:uncharacterized protein N7474_008206 [Penicillium riverlandense]KAJ5811905.1 hypothetical protein N7474_008206 [Penicillium riverlandense]
MTQVEMLKLLILKTSWEMDQVVASGSFTGYSRHYPFEHIYRHFRRYRITEGSEEIQMRKVAAYLFGFGGKSTQKEKL